MIILTIATLRRYNACNLSRRLREYRAHHGHMPGRRPTLRSWLACTPDVRDWIWVTHCLGREGRILALEVATRAGRRALAAARWDHVADPRPLRAVEAAEAILGELWAGREPTEEMRAAAKAAAAYAAYAAAYAAADASDAEAAAARAACAAADAVYAAAYAVYAALSARAACAAADAERDQQRADYLAALDRLESPDAR